MRELVECPHCGYKFRTDVKAIEDDGEITAVRNILHWKPKPRRVKSIDLECPNCKKRFEYEVES
jgi:sarcosine oxidase delta subunit